MKKKSVLVVFGEEFPKGDLSQYDAVIAGEELKKFIEPGSIYEASNFLEEISRLKLADGSRLTKSVVYKGYELWWIHYDSLFLYFCLPYTQYRKLLDYLKSFQNIYLYNPPYKALFSCYLKAHGRNMLILRKLNLKSPSFLPLGIFFQIFITLLCLPILIIKKRHLMIFIGDKFEKLRDYDFRMKFIYQELRQRNLPFVEFIRSLESWKTVLQHVFKRKRPIIYSEAVAFVGRFMSILSGGRRRGKRKSDIYTFSLETDPEMRFKFLIATQYFLTIYDDIWTIRIMKWILRAIGIKAAFIPAASERNFSAVLSCKLNAIPTIGILHGVASRYYNGYDFLPGFDGEKMLSVDKYGLWSEWWKEYYLKNSKAYRPKQLYVSGPMRPLEKGNGNSAPSILSKSESIKILFVSEQLAIPHEVIPYLETLLQQSDIKVIITFRQYRDGFKDWLTQHMPQVLRHSNIKIARDNLQTAIQSCDVAVGSHSTAVLETLLQLRIPIFFRTQKYGDYYNLKEYDKKCSFFAENPEELIEKIKKARSVSIDTVKNLQERYFGDPYKNGSKWVVDQLEDILLRGCITK